MNTRETFTAEEISELLRKLDVDVYIGPNFDDESEFITIDCEIGPIEFFCTLFPRGPFFDQLTLRAFRRDIENCLVFANNYNSGFRISHAVVEADGDGVPIVDEENETSVHAEYFIHFVGGVTADHITYLFELWIEELIDFYELKFEDEDESNSELEVEVDVPRSPEFLELPLVERIVVYLSLNSDCTARKMSKVLGFDRHEINQILYKHRDRFSRTKSQPPRWSAIS